MFLVCAIFFLFYLFCPNKMSYGKNCLHKNAFQSLDRSDYQGPEGTFLSQVRNIAFEERTNSFFSWCVSRCVSFLKKLENQFQMFLADWFLQHAQPKSVFSFQSTKVLASTTVRTAKRALKCSIFHLRWRSWHQPYLVEIVQISLQRRRAVTTKKKNHPRFARIFSVSHNQTHAHMCRKKWNSIHLWLICVDFPFVDTVNQNFLSRLILCTFSLQ